MDFMDNEVELFDDLNDESSELYKKNLIKTNCYIEKLNLLSSKRKIFKSYAKISGPIDDILVNINHGTAPNIVHDIFKNLFKDNNMCLLCNSTRVPLERAHCNIYPRPDLLRIAIENNWVDEDTSILIIDIIMDFIKLHGILCPIYPLCKECHKKYDKYSKKKLNTK
jgi:hypothetical protein